MLGALQMLSYNVHTYASGLGLLFEHRHQWSSKLTFYSVLLLSKSTYWRSFVSYRRMKKLCWICIQQPVDGSRGLQGVCLITALGSSSERPSQLHSARHHFLLSLPVGLAFVPMLDLNRLIDFKSSWALSVLWFCWQPRACSRLT